MRKKKFIIFVNNVSPGQILKNSGIEKTAGGLLFSYFKSG